MKPLLAILFVIVMGTQQLFAQASKKLDALREKVLPRYSTYFTRADLTDNGKLTLTGSDAYSALALTNKKPVIADITTAWQDSLVIVSCGTKRELWGWNARTSETRLLDEWDMAIPVPANIPASNLQKTNLHPWFFYLGGQLMGDSQKNINLSLNVRLGFFLLKDRWDLATTFSAGSSGNIDATGSPYSNIGAMTRVHFPIKKYGVSPNIGVEVSMATFGEAESTYVPSLVVGLGWFVGFGRIDIGVRIGDITSGMGGLTMYPGLKRTK
jgi:hypothetical protein